MTLSDKFIATLPAQARVVVADQVPADFSLRPEETESCGQMSIKRRHEFELGRYCARAALAALGEPDVAVPKTPSRAPMWPDRIVGSISHTRALGVATVAHTRDLIGIGIDLESGAGLQTDLIAMICRPEERTRLSATSQPERLAKIIFSAKESLYKCIWPTVRAYVDFQDVEVRLDLTSGRYSALAHKATVPEQLLPRLRGHFFDEGDLLATTAYIKS